MCVHIIYNTGTESKKKTKGKIGKPVPVLIKIFDIGSPDLDKEILVRSRIKNLERLRIKTTNGPTIGAWKVLVHGGDKILVIRPGATVTVLGTFLTFPTETLTPAIANKIVAGIVRTVGGQTIVPLCLLLPLIITNCVFIVHCSFVLREI